MIISISNTWTVHTVNQIFWTWNSPHKNLFTSAENTKLPIYYTGTRSECTGDECIYHLLEGYSNIVAYAFPPPILLNRVLNTERELHGGTDSPITTKTGLVSNDTRSSGIVSLPLKLPDQDNLLTRCRGKVLHPDPASLKLVVWKLSRDKKLQRFFLT